MLFEFLEMQGCPECNYKGHCRINAYGEPFCECFRWFGGSKCHINLKGACHYYFHNLKKSQDLQ